MPFVYAAKHIFKAEAFPILVFDEIDARISGALASLAGLETALETGDEAARLIRESAIMAQTRARFGRPTQILVSIGPAAAREKTLSAFALVPNFEAKAVKGLDFASIEDAYRTDYLIVWFDAEGPATVGPHESLRPLRA